MKGFGFFSRFTKHKPNTFQETNTPSDDFMEDNENLGDTFSVSFADVTPFKLDISTTPMLLRRERECEIMRKYHLYQNDSEGNIIGRQRLVEYKSK